MVKKLFLLLLLGLFLSPPAMSEEFKSLSQARLLSAILPGAGQFYLGNIGKGLLDLGIETVLIGGTIACFKAAKNAPQSVPEVPEDGKREMTKGDYNTLGIILGLGAVGYYVAQIWKLNDDVKAYNYKKRFLSSLKLSVQPKGVLLTFSF
jgi:hypothetical protein